MSIFLPVTTYISSCNPTTLTNPTVCSVSITTSPNYSISTKPSITTELANAFIAWCKKPGGDETDTVMKELIEHKQAWCYEMRNLIDTYDTKKVYDHLIELFPFLNKTIEIGHRKKFKVLYNRFVVFKFITNTIERTVEMTCDYTDQNYPERKIVRGPIITEIYVVQTPLNWRDEKTPLDLFSKDKGKDIKNWCESHTIKPEQINRDVKLPHMIITTHNPTGVDTIIRPLINKDDELYKPDKNEHVLFCNYKYNSDDFVEIYYNENVWETKEYDQLYAKFEQERVNIKIEPQPEIKAEPQPEINLTAAQLTTLIKSAEMKKTTELTKTNPRTTIYDDEIIKLKKQLADLVEQERQKEIDNLKRKRDELTKQLEKLV